MAKPLNFQQIIMKLHEFWTAQNCVLWQPYNIQVGAGTGNPATLLRVLGPEPWRVAYVEPTVRPDDGRYGENPNRMQYYFQYQVILKPDPGNPQELYIKSLEALGINPREHDIRFVEDNWESPALGAWGLGWEVWLDGQEISQFTYFQQAGGIELQPVSVEITYGLERITQPLQGKDSVWNIEWLNGDDGATLFYRDVLLRSEIEHCIYNFEIADVDGLRTTYDIFENEYKRALDAGLVIPAYDYVLKCSHLFNVLDARGAIGVTERASYFRRMRDMTRKIAKAYTDQRQEMEYPLDKLDNLWKGRAADGGLELATRTVDVSLSGQPADFLFEIGVEELPADDVDSALDQLGVLAPKLLTDLRLAHGDLKVYATPRRLVIHAQGLVARQTDLEQVAKGPAVDRAYDASGKPTKAAEGFARGKGVKVEDLRTEDGYVVATVRETGRPAVEVLAEALPGVVAALKFPKSMRWNASNVAFSRPIRWFVALRDGEVIPFRYADVIASDVTRGLRPFDSPLHPVKDAAQYFVTLESEGILLDIDARRASVVEQVEKLAVSVGGRVPEDSGLLDEVTNLVERPTALLGRFEEKYLKLPREVLVTVMRKHQRYFAVEDASGKLMPYFIAVRNGDAEHLDKVIHGNEEVIRARFSDADYFYAQDTKKKLADFLPRLGTLTFQEKLGSMLDKNGRLEALVEPLSGLLKLDAKAIGVAKGAAKIAKADLATQMVVEMTSLQGTMGRVYALRDGQSQAVANAVYEHWLPRGAGNSLPETSAGTLLAVADRLDSLVGLFAAGLEPKSTTDPYGLRRAALGIIEILVEKELDLDLRLAVEAVASAQPIAVTADVKQAVLAFISGRLRGWVEEHGWAHDVSAAVLAEQAHNPARALEGIRELSEWVKRDDWEGILDGFARCVRITRTEKDRYPVNPSLFQQTEEINLYNAYEQASVSLDEHGDGNINEFLTAFAPMIPAISAYFGTGKGDGVLVNTEDAAVRRNRIGQLQAISAMQDGRADLSQLSGF